jgi:hypothetical protein
VFDTTAALEAGVTHDGRRALAGPVRLRWAGWEGIRHGLASNAHAGPGELAAIRLACRQGFVVTHEQVRACGMNRARVRQLVRNGAWTVPHRGVLGVAWAPDGGPRGYDGIELRAAATVLVRPGMVVSHDCAAAMHGLPLLHSPERVSLTATWRPGACAWPGIVIRVAALPGRDVGQWFGAPVTTIARTVIDIARHSMRGGLVAADAALHEQLISFGELTDVLNRQRGWPGVRGAREVCALASPKSESPLESLTRLFLYQHGLRLPEPQVWVHTDRGRYRVDGLWLDRHVVLEVDGMAKYREGSLSEEKRRQEALERAGYRVVRVTWDDIHKEPAVTLARIMRALRLGGTVGI